MALTKVLQPGVDWTTGQIPFPAAQNASSDANTLDDYEEGTWTPTLTGATSGTVALTNKNGYYIKIGKLVYIYFNFDENDGAALTGIWRIGGLPYTAGNQTVNQVYYGVGNFSHYRLFPTSAGSTGIFPVVIKNTTYMQIAYHYGGAATTETMQLSTSGTGPSTALECAGSCMYEASA
jgi:hypothetical protein